MELAWQDDDVLGMPTLGTRITAFDGLDDVTGGDGAKLAWARARASAFRAEFASTGTPAGITTCDLVTLPYPTRFGLFRASRAVAPFVSITWQQEAFLNANTLETTADQYNSLILEKTLVDRAQSDPRFLQFFPSSELTASWANPGTAPTFTHQAIHHAA